MELCNEHRGIQLDYRYEEASNRSTLRYELPLSEIATEFFSKLKSRRVDGAFSGFLELVLICCCTCGLVGVKGMLRLIMKMLGIRLEI